jgi:hypothetical protein
MFRWRSGGDLIKATVPTLSQAFARQSLPLLIVNVSLEYVCVPRVAR